MELIKEDVAMPISAMAKRLGISPAQVRTALVLLKKTERIYREGLDKGGRWVMD